MKFLNNSQITKAGKDLRQIYYLPKISVKAFMKKGQEKKAEDLIKNEFQKLFLIIKPIMARNNIYMDIEFKAEEVNK